MVTKAPATPVVVIPKPAVMSVNDIGKDVTEPAASVVKILETMQIVEGEPGKSVTEPPAAVTAVTAVTAINGIIEAADTIGAVGATSANHIKTSDHVVITEGPLAASEDLLPSWRTPDSEEQAPLQLFSIVKHKLSLTQSAQTMLMDTQDEALSVHWVNGEIIMHVLSYQPSNPNGTVRNFNIVPAGADGFRMGHPGIYVGNAAIPHNGLTLHVFEGLADDSDL